jgi:tRNA(His) guanylyltransferase
MIKQKKEISTIDNKSAKIFTDEKKDQNKSVQELNSFLTNLEKLDLGERMKLYEKNSLEVTSIPPYEHFLVRLDGRSFSKFTAGLRKPFDLAFTKAMGLTTYELIHEFSAVTGYTHSDEITIIFKQACNKEEFDNKENKTTHIFDGRVMKLLTVMSGYCSVRFNYHLVKLINSINQVDSTIYKSHYVNKINEMKASFDSRLLIVPSQGEILNHMLWRSIFDCERNAVSTYARSYYNQKTLQGKSKKEMIQMMKEEKSLDWLKDVPLILRHGVYVKKVNYELEGEEKLNNNKLPVIRTKPVFLNFRIKYSDFYIKFLLDKLYVKEEGEIENEIFEFDIESI